MANNGEWGFWWTHSFSLSNGTLERVLLHTWCWAVSERWVKPPSSRRNQSFDLSQNSGHDWSVEVKKREMFLLSYCFLQFRNQNLKQSPTFKGSWEATVETVTITHYWNQFGKFCLNVPKIRNCHWCWEYRVAHVLSSRLKLKDSFVWETEWNVHHYSLINIKVKQFW